MTSERTLLQMSMKIGHRASAARQIFLFGPLRSVSDDVFPISQPTRSPASGSATPSGTPTKTSALQELYIPPPPMEPYAPRSVKGDFEDQLQLFKANFSVLYVSCNLVSGPAAAGTRRSPCQERRRLAATAAWPSEPIRPTPSWIKNPRGESRTSRFTAPRRHTVKGLMNSFGLSQCHWTKTIARLRTLHADLTCGVWLLAGRLRPISMPVECNWGGDYEDPAKLHRENRRGESVFARFLGRPVRGSRTRLARDKIWKSEFPF